MNQQPVSNKNKNTHKDNMMDWTVGKNVIGGWQEPNSMFFLEQILNLVNPVLGSILEHRYCWLKKMHNLKFESYALYEGQNWRLKPRT